MHTTLPRAVPDFWPLILPFFRRCTPRVLVVTDGLSFGPDAFGLSRFLDELGKALPAPDVTTEVHDAGGFVFDGSVTVDHYDQVWLFGVYGPALTDAEVQVLAAFMEAGGGVFATGDHETLGQALCGDLPRVRKMRDWHSVPMSLERIDTVTNPGPDRITQFDDQADDIPQRVFPKYYGSGSSWSVHPLLRSALGDIDVLPDHPHESVCLAGYDLADDYLQHDVQLDEFPALGGTPLAPEIVAWSVSAGRYLNPPGPSGKPPTTPRLFGAISAWDGHRVGRGRIVCDATWHHFVNVNLDGTDTAPAPGNTRRGLRDANLAFTVDFHQIAQYYRNILDWLVPPHRRWCRWWIDLILERYRFPLFEEFVELPPHPCPWDPRVALGARVDVALSAAFGRGRGEDIATAALEAADLPELAELVRPVATDDPRLDKRSPTLIDPVEVRQGVLGTVASVLLAGLPTSPARLPEHLDDGHDDDALAARVAEATREAFEAAREHFAGAQDRTARLFER